MRNAFVKAIANGKPEPIKACMNAMSTHTTSMESWLTYSTDHPARKAGFFITQSKEGDTSGSHV